MVSNDGRYFRDRECPLLWAAVDQGRLLDPSLQRLAWPFAVICE
jgi:hypothetical protein